ncbi:MAG: hypothetical protein IT434_13400 [Phycisphaerales bacterium]|jgi:hypothetical protein|nr:hypothetical protein [Phycisphaerales bacterium]
MLRSILIPSAVLAAVILLLLSGFEKTQDVTSFESILRSHALVASSDLLPLLSRIIPVGEIVVASLSIFLLLRKRPRPALLLLAVIAGAFAFYALALVVNPPPAPTKCGCGVLRGAEAADWTFISTTNFLAAAVLSLLRAFAK